MSTEAVSRICQEVDEEANIIVGAIVEPTLDEALRVSVVATGIDQKVNSRIDHVSAQSLAQPVLHPSFTPPAPEPVALKRRLFPLRHSISGAD